MNDPLGVLGSYDLKQKNEPKKCDELEQIGLSESKRMPNFMDQYGLKTVSSLNPKSK